VAVETPRVRQVGKGANRKFQWMFADGEWRDMVPNLPTRNDFGALKATGAKHPTSGYQMRTFADVAAGTNIFPDYFKENTASAYAAVLGTLWGEITGIDPDNIQWSKSEGIKASAPMPGFNWDGRDATWQTERELLPEGSPDLGVTWNEAAQTEMAQYISEAAEDTAADYNWPTVALNRGYDIDFSSPSGIYQFLSQTQADLERGRIYTDHDNYKGLDYAAEALGPRMPTDQERRDAMPISPTDRKVVGEYVNQTMANAAAQSIENATVEQSNGKWVVTVPPGQGGWGSAAAAQTWLDQTSGENAGNFEVAPGGQGQWYVREKADTATPGQFDTRAAAEQWLRETGGIDDPTGTGKISPEGYEVVAGPGGKWIVREKAPTRGGQFANKTEAERWLVNSGNPEGFEAVPGPEGKWVVREKRPDMAYSTPTTTTTAGEVVPGTPGDMFEPTVTEDPTGRRFGLTAGGDIKDFGYGMAGDITQESLAGYQVPHRSLDMIVAKAIEQGNWELARGVQAFIDRPTETDLLRFAAQYAESPADLAVLSAIARGETMVQPGVALPEGMGAGMGQATRIGAPGAEYTSAYKQFKDAMDMGFDPTLPENQEALNDLFKPENDPVYQATQELANKYETEIGALRDQIADINAKATERIENTQTSTLNMMSGLFSDTLGSFQDLMKSQNDASAAQINNLQNLYQSSLTGTNLDSTTGLGKDSFNISYNQSGAGQPAATGPDEDLSPKNIDALMASLTPEQRAWVDSLPNGIQSRVATSRNMTELRASLDFSFKGLGLPNIGEAAVTSVIDHVDEPGSMETIVTGDDSTGFTVPTSEDVIQSTTSFAAPAGRVDPGLFENLVQGSSGTFTPGGQGAAAKYTYSEPEMERREDFQTAFEKTPDPTFGIRYAFDPDEFAEGGIVQGPTMAMLGEEEPEFIVPFSKVDAFKRGQLPLGKPRQSQMGGAVAKFEDSIPRFANGGLVTGPRFGGVTASQLQPYGETGAFVTPGTRKELDLGAEGQYGEDGISRAPRIGASDFESLFNQYTTRQTPIGPQMLREGMTREEGLARIPEYELRQRLGASEFAGTNPTQHPIGIQQLMAGRPIARPRSLMTAANMPKPSGQALRNMLPSETAYYQKMGRMAGIPQEELEREMRSVMPGGTRRTPLRMGARRIRQA
jgi:hypothetical protein